MIQLVFLNGSQAGRQTVARRFPFQVGRASDSHLVLEGDGVWDRHAEILFQPREGFFLQSSPGALVFLNGARAEKARLRNGDLIECGSAKLRFWLAPLGQASLRPRELLTWLALAALFAFQIAVVYLLAG